LWMATAAICLFTACSEVSRPQGRGRELLLAGGLFSLLLCLDDMFLLHDRYISANVLYLLYIVFAALILVHYRDLVLRLGGPVFVGAVVLLGTSLLFDKFLQVLPIAYGPGQLFEEGVKFLGIASWLFFWWRASAGVAKLRAAS
ncbi:MAG: oxidoreductase, partial [Cyanobium sp.]